MKKRTVLVSVTLLLIFAVQSSASAPVLPNPVLYFLGPEFLTISGKQVTRYNFDVLNKTEYPNDLFAAAPDLPPCGTNTKAARTWVDIYDQSGKRLNGFCALGKPADLHGIWFSLDSGAVPPSWVYIEMTDRKTNTKYKSNLSETTY
jgi:hypothetical protein